MEKLRTLAGSLVTWALFAQTVLTLVVSEGADYVHIPAVAQVVAWATVALGWVGLAIRVASRLTPVPESVQGLTPQHPLDVAAAISAEYKAEQQSFWSGS